jgi:hypothetical protein
MKYLVGILFFFTLSMAVWADSPEAARKRVEMSMLITGSVDVSADGSVRSYELDEEDKLPAAVVDLVHRSAQGWRFVPYSADGATDSTRFKMSLRIVSHRQNDGSYAMSLAGATFDNKYSGQAITVKEMARPANLLKVRQAGTSGTVYAVLRISRDGRVSDAAVEQVNIGMLGTDSELKERRAILAQSVLGALERSTFNVPTVGPQAAKDDWVIRVALDLHVLRPEEAAGDSYGHWSAYVPGPKEIVPWLKETQSETDSSTDALASGQVHQTQGSPKLLTPLSPI